MVTEKKKEIEHACMGEWCLKKATYTGYCVECEAKRRATVEPVQEEKPKKGNKKKE